MAALIYKDDHNKVAYLEKRKGWEAYEQILDFLIRSRIQYALTHHPPIVFNSLVKQFWATATVRTLEAGPSKIIATIDGNEDGPHMPLLAPMFVVLAGGDGADAAAAGATTANEVPPPLPPHAVPLIHSSSSTPGPSTATPDTHVRDLTPVREPTPSPGELEPIRLVDPWPTSPTTPFHTTTLTRPPSPTRQPSFQEDISEVGGDYVSSPKSNEAPPTTAAGGAEDSAALTDLSLKLDRCINRVTTLENELGVIKKVLGGAVLMLVSRVKRLEGLLQQRKRRVVLSNSEGEEAATKKEKGIDLYALHNLASMSLGGDTTVEAAFTIYKA
nr:hypothetical protein [Tanacetum cinerariifolium]